MFFGGDTSLLFRFFDHDSLRSSNFNIFVRNKIRSSIDTNCLERNRSIPEVQIVNIQGFR
jgi:hypothetical protein